MDKTANRSSWKTLPLPAQRAKLDIERVFTEQDYLRLKNGLIPRAMEDKWFIFMENDVLSFHRSWTGTCIYEVHFDKQRAITDVWVNRDGEQYKEADNEYDKRLLNFLIDNLLLGKSTLFPMLSNLPSDLPKGMFQHSVSGTGYPEKQDQEKDTLKMRVKRIFKRKGN
jgi:hypothetical protein